MHLDERLEKSREVLNRQLAVGQKKVSSAFNNLWAEMEAMREAQRKRAEETRLQREKERENEPASPAVADAEDKAAAGTAGAGNKCMSFALFFSYSPLFFYSDYVFGLCGPRAALSISFLSRELYILAPKVAGD